MIVFQGFDNSDNESETSSLCSEKSFDYTRGRPSDVSNQYLYSTWYGYASLAIFINIHLQLSTDKIHECQFDIHVDSLLWEFWVEVLVQNIRNIKNKDSFTREGHWFLAFLTKASIYPQSSLIAWLVAWLKGTPLWSKLGRSSHPGSCDPVNFPHLPGFSFFCNKPTPFPTQTFPL